MSSETGSPEDLELDFEMSNYSDHLFEMLFRARGQQTQTERDFLEDREAIFENEDEEREIGRVVHNINSVEYDEDDSLLSINRIPISSRRLQSSSEEEGENEGENEGDES